MQKFEFGEGAVPAERIDPQDPAFLSTIRWKKSAAPALVRAARKDDSAAFSAELRRSQSSLAKEARGVSSASGASGSAIPSLMTLWSEEAFPLSERARQLVKRLKGLSRKRAGGEAEVSRNGSRVHSSNGHVSHSTALDKSAAALVEEWLDARSDSAETSPFELLLLLEWLPHAGSRLEPLLFERLWRELLVAAGQSMGQSPEELSDRYPELDQQLVLCGELPWRIGLAFPSVQGADRLQKAGMRFLEREVLDRTDALGIPDAALLARFSFWLASLVRVIRSSQEGEIPFWDEAASNRFRNLAQRFAPLCQPDGRIVLSAPSAQNPEESCSIVEAAFRLSDWSEAETACHSLLVPKDAARRNGKSSASGRRAPEEETNGLCLMPVFQSDDAELTCMRSGWSADADLLAVAHHGRFPEIELSALGRSVFRGPWTIELSIAGKPLPLKGKWEAICWNSDEDADFLELQLSVPGVVRIERQILLSRGGRFAIFADSLSGLPDERIDCTIRLPLDPAVSLQRDSQTRECQLKRAGVAARVFPVALPQERVIGTAGELAPDGAGLLLKQASPGKGMYVPLIVDWDPGRQKAPAQWRSLTVTEEGKVLPPNVAAGHRLKLGMHQLLVFHGLVRSHEPRAVLGHQTRNETSVGLIDVEGDFAPILFIE